MSDLQAAGIDMPQVTRQLLDDGIRKVKVMSWYDNEWGYANQMVREAVSMTVGR